MSRRQLLRTAVASLAAGATVTVASVAVSAPHAPEPALGPGVVTVEIDIEHSRFVPSRLRVRQGTVVELVVRNEDPIDHELVIGADAVHARHATGTERRHPPVPGEVSVAPSATGTTFYEASTPGTVRYVCHLPGHESYGMVGELEVVPR